MHLVVHSFASGESANAQHEPELVPSAVIMGLVDAHSIVKQANDEGDRSDYSVPESSQETGGLSARLFVHRNRPSNGENIRHERLQV